MTAESSRILSLIYRSPCSDALVETVLSQIGFLSTLISAEPKKPAKKSLRAKLYSLREAASFASSTLSDWDIVQHLEQADLHLLSVEVSQIQRLLNEVAARAEKAAAAIPIKGKAPALPLLAGTKRPPGALGPRIFCGLLVVEIWRAARGREPARNDLVATEAAATFWRAAGGSDLSDDEEGKGWPYWISKAREVDTESFTGILPSMRRHTRSVIEAAAV